MVTLIELAIAMPLAAAYMVYTARRVDHNTFMNMCYDMGVEKALEYRIGRPKSIWNSEKWREF